MAQRLTPSVSAGDVVLLLAIVAALLPSGAAGERIALAGTLCAGWLIMSGGRTPLVRDISSGLPVCGRFAEAASAHLRSPGTRAVTGARRAGREVPLIR